MISVEVVGDQLKIGSKTLHTDSVGYYNLNITFTGDEWTGLTKYVVFKNLNGVYRKQYTTTSVCSVPQEVLRTDQECFFGIYGTNNDEDNLIRIVTGWYKLGIQDGCFVLDAEDPATPTPTIVEILEGEIEQEIADREIAIDEEADIRENADNTLQDKIDKEIISRELADNDIKKSLPDAIEASTNMAKSLNITDGTDKYISEIELLGEGSQSGTPSLASPQDINYISNPHLSFFNKNILNLTSVRVGYKTQCSLANGVISATTTTANSGGYCQTNTLYLYAGKTYYVTYDFDANGTSRLGKVYWFTDSLSTVKSSLQSFTPTESGLYRITFYVNGDGAVGDTVKFSNIQVTVDSSLDNYYEYDGQEIEFTDYELCAVPNGTDYYVRDRIYVKDGKAYYEQNICKHEFVGTEASSVTDLGAYFTLPCYAYTAVQSLCNYSTPNNHGYDFANNKVHEYASLVMFSSAIPSTVTDKASANAWLLSLKESGTPLTLVYVRSTPIVTDISDTDVGKKLIKLHTYSPNTTVLSDCDTKVVYRLSTKDYIDNSSTNKVDKNSDIDMNGHVLTGLPTEEYDAEQSDAISFAMMNIAMAELVQTSDMSISEFANDDKIPTSKAVKDYVDEKNGERTIQSISTSANATIVAFTSDSNDNAFALTKCKVFGELNLDVSSLTTGSLVLRVRTNGGNRYLGFISSIPYATGKIHFSTESNYDSNTGITKSTAIAIEGATGQGTSNSRQSFNVCFGIANVTTINDVEIFVLNGSTYVPILADSKITIMGVDA